jgi:hypothetical protein
MLMPKVMPWYMAQMRKIMVTNMTLPLIWSQAFWEMWAEVYHGADNG